MSEEEIVVDEREERRMEWINILKDCMAFHIETATSLKSPIIGAQDTEQCVMHQVWAHSIRDAVGLIELLPLIDKDNNENSEEDLPQHQQGPLG